MASQAYILAGVVVYVSCGHNEQRMALLSRLRGLGAQIAQRLGKEVSHVVFSRSAGPTPEQKMQEDVELRYLFDRARKVGCCRSHARRRLRLVPRLFELTSTALESPAADVRVCMQSRTASQVECQAVFVTPLWVQSSADMGRRALVSSVPCGTRP